MKQAGILSLTLLLGAALVLSVPAAEVAPLTKAPAGDGWVPLFNGQNLDGWHYRGKPDATNLASWCAINGVLVNVPPTKEGLHGIDLISDTSMGSHELYIEFMVPQNSNSGVYLIGQYEIQVFDSFGKEKPTDQDCGAIYGKVAPSTNASKSPGAWQCFHAIYHQAKVENGKVVQKPRITVFQNGVKILDHVEIEGVTGAALNNNVIEKGPLYLQGNHGLVLYRNIYYKPIQE